VGADVVAGDEVARAVEEQRHARLTVAADDVAFQVVADAVGVGADAVVRGDADADAVDAVLERGGAVLVGADEVARDDVVVGGRAQYAVEAEDDAVVGVAADLVALVRVVAAVAVGADDVVGGAVVDPDAVVRVGQGGGAVRVGADAVALDLVEAGAGAKEVDAVAVVAGN